MILGCRSHLSSFRGPPQFDRCISELQSKKIPLKVQENNNYEITKTDGTSSNYVVRVVTLDDVLIRLAFENSAITPNSIGDARIFLEILDAGKYEGRVFQLNMGWERGWASAKIVPRPRDGIPPKELTDSVNVGIGKGLERFLVLSNAKKVAP